MRTIIGGAGSRRRGSSAASAASLALAGVLIGCAGKDLPAKYQVWTTDVEGAQSLSQGVVIVADNQQQYIYGQPVWIQSPLADRFVGTAIRAPQLDLFGPSVLEWVIDNHADLSPVIHLGDGLNLSCTAEYERFFATMSRAQKGWFMAPGNHDGIYFGSSDSNSEWAAVCEGDAPITQATFVERYVSENLAGLRGGSTTAAPVVRDIGTQRFAREFQNRKKGGNWAYSDADAGCTAGASTCPMLSRVAWRVDDQAPYKSFVLQELTVTRPKSSIPVKYILLDTSNYEKKPVLIPTSENVNAGMKGDLTEEQLRVLGEWLEAERTNGTLPYVVFMGHHPFSALTARAQAAVEELRRTYGVLLYVSAHTHHGDYFVNGPDESSWLELNVGSTVDWPLEFRSLRLLLAPPAMGGVPYTNSPLYELGKNWVEEDAPDCAEAWKPQANDPDYYVTYTKDLLKTPMQARALIYNSLLASYKRMLSAIPSSPQNQDWPAGSGATSDATVIAAIDLAAALGTDSGSVARKRALLVALEDFDRKRSLPATLAVAATQPAAPAAPDARGSAEAAGAEAAPSPQKNAALVHRDYRLCQAIWASADDKNGVRKARREDWYIAYPKRAAQ